VTTQQELTLEIIGITGDTSFESYYWNSGWFTAEVQLLTGLDGAKSIIDVGCGAGRLAHGIYQWFGGRYVGVDIVPRLVDFCRARFPRYEFHCLDVHSPYYNPQGSKSPDAMRIPLPDATFDVAVLLSVFTHLLPERFQLMTTEVGRLLKPGGRCLATFFITDDMTDRAAASFKHHVSPACRVEDPDMPEVAVGYEGAFVVDAFRTPGLTVASSYRGSWSGKGGLGYQDHMLFVKDSPTERR